MRARDRIRWRALPLLCMPLAMGAGACSRGSKGQPQSQPIAADPRALAAVASSSAAITRSDALGIAARATDGAAGTTPAAAVVRFAALGDTGMGNAGQRKVAAALAKKCAADGCDFVWMLGDNFYQSGVSSVTDPLWKERFEDMYAGTKTDFFAVLGNHDYGGNGAGTDFAKAEVEVDYTKVSARWKMPARYYRVKKGLVDFFALDSNAQLFGRDADQRADVAGWIGESTARWKIAAAHHPYRSNGPHGNAGSYNGLGAVPLANGQNVKAFDEGIVCGKVDLLMSGHDHTRQWMKEPCGGTELVLSGTGSEGTSLPGKNGTWFQSVRLGFVHFVVEEHRLTVDFIDEDGKSELSRSIEKP